VSDLPFGGTDCALPMLYATANPREVDTFVIFTDAETWAGDIHPAQALREYRRASGIDARLVVVGMVSNGFTIADPADQGCSTSSASTRRRRSSSPTSHAALSERRAPRAPITTRGDEMHRHLHRVHSVRPHRLARRGRATRGTPPGAARRRTRSPAAPRRLTA
jgi:hypothetical protein